MHHNVLGDQTCAAQNCDILNIKKNKLHNIIIAGQFSPFFPSRGELISLL